MVNDSATARYPKTRRVRFPFGTDGQYGKYFVNDDSVFSHFVASLSGAFPPGRRRSSGRCATMPTASPTRS